MNFVKIWFVLFLLFKYIALILFFILLIQTESITTTEKLYIFNIFLHLSFM